MRLYILLRQLSGCLCRTFIVKGNTMNEIFEDLENQLTKNDGFDDYWVDYYSLMDCLESDETLEEIVKKDGLLDINGMYVRFVEMGLYNE